MYLKNKDIRQRENFNLNWFFYHGEEIMTPGEPDTTAYRPVKLPHDWSLEYPFDEHAVSCGSGGYAETGIGWYKKRFQVNPDMVPGRRILLHFDGAYMLAKIWINGHYLGQHVYGYTPFEWDITDWLHLGNRENVVDVQVDNSAQPSSRWYSGSGITRDVWICGVNEIHVAPYGVHIAQSGASEKQVSLTVETMVCIPNIDLSDVSNTTGTSFLNESGINQRRIHVETSVYSPDGILCLQELSSYYIFKYEVSKIKGSEAGISNDKSMLEDDSMSIDESMLEDDRYVLGDLEYTQLSFHQELILSYPTLWNTDHPSLYHIITKVYSDGILQDEVVTITGFRDASFDSEQGFLLNGIRVKLNGVCLHHDGGCVGAAVPMQIWERRLKKLKDMGVNAIRMAHNPPDPSLLDLCDQMGFLVMDESFDEWRILKGKELGSNSHESRGYSEWFDSCHEADIRTMLLRDRNHPSIILWSIGNEVPEQTTADGYLTARHLKDICKALDPSRAVTQGNDQICAEPNRATEEFLSELDVVGYNYVNRWRNRMETLYEDDKRTHPNRCIVGTENMGLGGTRGQYLLANIEHAGWWKQPYYSAPVQIGKLLHYTMTHDYVAGDFMWTGIDYLGESHWPAHSASAGVLDTCGFEKDSFYFYKSIWKRTEPMVHLLPHWNLNMEEGTILQVLGYTSCDAAELFLNGKSYGKKAYAYPSYGMTKRYGHYDKAPEPVNTDDLFLSWDVPYVPGCIELVGYIDGIEAAHHVVRTAGEPASVRLTSYRYVMKGDGLDIAQIEAEILDAQGNLCVQADTELTFTITGPASVIAVDSGNPEEMQSMKVNHIHAFHGRALAIIQSTGEPDIDGNRDAVHEENSPFHNMTTIEAAQCSVCVSAENLIGDTVLIQIIS